MGIQMIGIDHSKAEIDVRTIFSFTKKNMAEALEQLKNREGILGTVMISTCNRMELWASVSDDFEGSLYEILCDLREVPQDLYREYFVKREEREAVEHLFELSCGLKSRILGEDQIITQVKNALTTAREFFAADNVLEVLFRMAVTAAKKVKTDFSLSEKNRSIVHQAASTLEEKGFSLGGKKCMVIGNGEIGKLAATVFLQAGADVTVTVRQYRSGIVEIPLGCKRIDYGNRMELFPDCELVVSATASPNFTLKEHCVREANLDHPVILLDLAVPRDIDPKAAELPFVTLYDVDDFKAEVSDAKLEADIAKAKGILAEQIGEFFDWYECRDVIPRIGKIKACAGKDLELRLQKVIRELSADEEEKGNLTKSMEQAAQKVVNKMLFGLRDFVSKETFRECVEALEKLYEEE